MQKIKYLAIGLFFLITFNCLGGRVEQGFLIISNNFRVSGTSTFNHVEATADGYWDLREAGHVEVPTPLDGNDAAQVDWVNSLFAGGTFLYACTNINPYNTNFYVFSPNLNPVNSSRVYVNPSVDDYIGTVMTTQRYFTVYSHATVNAYMGVSANPDTASVHPEFYYSYDGTNLLGDYESETKTLSTGSNLFVRTISYATITATNDIGFFIVRKFKVDTAYHDPTITIYLGGSTPSHISFTTPPETDLGIRGGTNIVTSNSSDTGSYNTITRTLTLPDSYTFGTNALEQYGGVLSGTNGIYWTYNGTNYWLLLTP